MFHAFAIEDIQKFNFDLCLLWQVKQQVGLYFPTLPALIQQRYSLLFFLFFFFWGGGGGGGGRRGRLVSLIVDWCIYVKWNVIGSGSNLCLLEST